MSYYYYAHFYRWGNWGSEKLNYAQGQGRNSYSGRLASNTAGDSLGKFKDLQAQAQNEDREHHWALYKGPEAS